MRFANAPVSYGVFGDITVEGATTTEELLRTMAETGYEGSELGPPGFFGEIPHMVASFAGAPIAAVGAYVPLHTQEPGAVLDRDLARMAITLDEIEAVDRSALVILADEGDEMLLRSPRKDPSLSLDADGWRRLVDTVNRAAGQARDRGLEVSFHPHIATYVELPDEIERLLESTDVGLTFDVGHVVLAGGDGVELFRRWRDRINHVHIKDVRIDVLEDARREGREDFDAWWSGVSTRLGEGDSDLPAFAAALRDTRYDRWVVVEQDRAPLVVEEYAAVVADQAANLDWLRRHLGA
ncbi:sugar phosphate isomerase/epimerase family protein [Microbacterium sp. ASV49]|uniref:Sugar phosphate isomerase/epimerase n=1 Tax=Microbacterium candidum TaxID=3041922 RepID=A0ABT7MU11_9MICO|nr:sugar phosphate isomerase/epimerase [Microbacterium sp. ASV49]MDL9977935.1 sugar phosphate isomerase/epimerase [Microbacterium sp. ASV49]